METMQKDYEVSTQSELIIGNNDSLILFGSDAQQTLREFSKSLSVMLLNSNGDLEYLINDILGEINAFQQSITENSFFSFLQSESTKRDKLIKRYDAVLVCIDKMELALKLQEAQIIKDSKMIEAMGSALSESICKLEFAIRHGKEVSRLRQNDNVDEEINNWYLRLDKRIEDLEISHTVSLQSQAQMQLLLENNAQLIDKILAAVTGTIPIWRNQVTLLLGIERMNRNLEVQNKVTQITNSYLSKSSQKPKKNVRKVKEIDTEKLITANEKLKNALDELKGVESKDSGIRLELNNSLM